MSSTCPLFKNYVKCVECHKKNYVKCVECHKKNYVKCAKCHKKNLAMPAQVPSNQHTGLRMFFFSRCFLTEDCKTSSRNIVLSNTSLDKKPYFSRDTVPADCDLGADYSEDYEIQKEILTNLQNQVDKGKHIT